MACRFPGAVTSPAALWELLRRGGDAIVEVPRDRWDVDALFDPDPDAPGRLYTRWGGFLDDIDRFDAGFFGIAPVEAIQMDPQQRLLLEVGWEALERAGLDVDALAGSSTGVYVGISSFEYGVRLLAAGRGTEIDAYTATGVSTSVAAGRIAYAFGLQGPTLAVDTACSSSLVAVHLACQSLGLGQCDLALAGGVNLMLSPESTIGMCRLHTLSPDGRCRTFSAQANGYVRAEGCGVVLLKRLADAVRDGNPVLAVIRGSAVNQDGLSNGLTAPNPAAQEAVIRQALAAGRVDPTTITYVEAHGTGTPLGDPIELEALGAVFASGRRSDDPLWVGAIKSNLGHAEAAAGVAGLIKTVLMLQHGEIPANLHCAERTPMVKWERLRLAVPDGLRPWPEARQRLVGLSSFGFSGTNAHLVVEAAPPAQTAVVDRPTASLLVLSARSEPALKALADTQAAQLARAGGPALATVAATLGRSRTHHAERLTVVARSPEEAATRLRAWTAGEASPGLLHGTASPGRSRRVAFVFPGQGGQWVAMGRALLAEAAVFREVIEACDTAMRPYADWRLVEVLRGEGPAADLTRVDVVQPAIFAMQVGLAALWRSYGVTPAAVVGHSMGEIAAAHVAGALSLDEACRTAVLRSRVARQASGRGRMAVVELTLAEARAAIAGLESRLSVAAVNSERSVVLSGDGAALEEVFARLEQAGTFCRWVKVDYASHSPQMDRLQPELRRLLSGQLARPPALAYFSAVSGALWSQPLDVDYWVRNLRETVLFWDALKAMSADAVDTFVEVNPHPVLTPFIVDGLASQVPALVALGSLRRDRGGLEELFGAVGELHVRGGFVDWARLCPGPTAPAELPTYPWQRQRFWVEETETTRRQRGGHPLLGTATTLSTRSDTRIFDTDLRLSELAYLEDHRVEGSPVLPGAAYVEMALAAAGECWGERACVVEDLALERPLLLAGERPVPLQLVCSEAAPGRASVTVSSRDETTGAWQLHAGGWVRIATGSATAGEAPALIRARCQTQTSGEALYAELARQGLDYGPRFRGVQAVWSTSDEAVGEVVVPAAASGGYRLAPALLDACLHVAAALPGVTDGEGGPAMPVHLREVRWHGRPAARMWSHVRVRQRDATDLEIDVRLVDEAGRPAVELVGVRLHRLDRSATASDERLLVHEWRSAALPAETPAGRPRVLLLADEGGFAAAVAERLRAQDAEVVLGSAADAAAALDEEVFGRPLAAVVHLGSLNEREATAAAFGRSCARDCGGAVAVVQALTRRGLREPPRLWLVTRGAQAAGNSAAVVQPGGALLWGLGRTIALEHPELRCTRVDLSAEPASSEVDALCRELLADGAEEEVALRAGERFVGRIVRRQPVALRRRRSEPAAGRPFELAQEAAGSLDRLELWPLERKPPGPGEVEIEVAAAGLNFWDVLRALGTLPGDNIGSRGWGGECAGRVVRVGAGVTGFSPGSEVVAWSRGALASHVTVPMQMVVAKPTRTSLEEAAGLPVALVTAWYALHDLARVQPGDRVLVHAASGGTGLAAVRLAQRIGAEVIATAGSDAKREFLRREGVEHVFDSRGLAFAQAVMAATGERGVDVVLNSLAGEAMVRSLCVVAPYGRFVELGKRDIYDNTQLGLAPFKRRLSYFAVDLAAMTVDRPMEVTRLLREALGAVERGDLRPLPVTVFRAGDTAGAFRTMAQARHIGKVVVAMHDPTAQLAVAPRAGALVSREASYLVTGGLGGLGLGVAEWLASQGAGEVVLVSRRGATGEGEERALAAARASGTRVRVIAADVSVRDDVARVVSEIARTALPLKGIIHAAGVLDDALLEQLDVGRFSRVMAPKVLGSWFLHELTRELSLDFFVMYASAAGLFGSPGQANYAAANAFMDALAHHRRALGLPALSIDWGTFAEVGLAAARAERGARLATRGVRSLTPAEGTALLGELIAGSESQIGVVPINLREWVSHQPQLAASSLVAELVSEAARGRGHAAQNRALLDAVRAAAADDRVALLEGYVREQLGEVLKLDRAQIGAETPFRNLGLDSLMGLELRNRLDSALGLKLPATTVWTHATSRALARHLAEQVGDFTAPAPTPIATGEPAHNEAKLEKMSEEEMAAELDKTLARLKGMGR